MPFDLQAATAADLPALVSVFQAAFDDNPHFKCMSPGCDPAVVRSRNLKLFRKDWDKPGRRHFKVLDRENGEIVAFAKWWFPHSLTPAQQAEEEYEESNPEALPPGFNVALCEDFDRQLVGGRKKWIIKSDMYFMNVLAVHPQYQRRGLGSLMLEPVLAMADKEARKVYIEASKKGVGLYRRYGWIEVDRMLVDTRPYGGKMIEETQLMIRDPGKGKHIEVSEEEILSVVHQG